MANYDASIRINTKVDNRELVTAQKEVESLSKKLASMYAQGDKLEALGVDKQSKQWKSLKYDVAQTEMALEDTREKLQRLNDVNVSEGFKKAEEASSKMFGVVSKGAKRSNGLLSTMATRLKGIALSLLVFNWITKGWNAMVSSMKEGSQNLAKYSAEYNKSMSALKTANEQLKNSFATAFAPIVQMVIPYLVNLINYMIDALNWISQFTAMLSGKSTWTKAAKVQKDYAASLDGTASAANRAKNALAGFDDIDVLNNDTSISGVSSPAFSEEQIESGMTNAGGAFKKLIDNFVNGDFFSAGTDASNLVAGIFDFFSNAIEKVNWDQIGTNIGDFLAGIDWIKILESLGKLIITAIDSSLDLWSAAFDAAPIEVGVITAIGLLKWSGITGSLFTPLGSAVSSTLGATLASAVGSALEAAVIGEITWYFGTDLIEKIIGKEGAGDALRERGFWGVMQDELDALSGMPPILGDASQAGENLSAAYEAIAQGVIYTDEQMTKMQEKFGYSADEMETLRQAMLDANPELRDLADNFTSLWDASVDTLSNISDGMKNVSDGTVSASEAFDEFSKPMWGMSDSALSFFKSMQDGSNNMKKIVAGNVEDSGKSITDSLSKTDQEMVRWLNKYSDSTKKSGKDTVAGFNEGIEESSSVGSVTKWQDTTLKAIHDGPLKFGSPSKTMKIYGANTVFGYDNGVEIAMGETKKVMSKWFTTSIDPYFTMERWKQFGDNVRTGFYSGMEGLANDTIILLNAIISSFETMSNQVLTSINSMIAAYNSVSGSSTPTVSSVALNKIPALAQGAVLRGGDPFFAIVNDQPFGQTNVETPLSTIEQAVQNVMDRGGSGMFGNMTVILELDGKQLARTELPYMQRESSRVGLSLKTI